MIAQLNKKDTRESTQLLIERPRVMYDSAGHDKDPFFDPALLHPVYSDQHEDICKAAERMIQNAADNGMLAKHSKELGKLVQ